MSDWPRTSDSLHGVGVWKAEALLGAFAGDGFYFYAAAYKEAADALVGEVLAARLAPDLVVYPALFLYRHYVELILKGIIEIGSSLEQSSPQTREHHRIDQLWQMARPLLEQAFAEGEKETTDAVENCIKELAAIDVDGEASRYPRKRQKRGGGPTWSSPLQLNLANMHEVMKGLSVFLDGSYDGMSELLQCQCDMDADLDWDCPEG